MKFKILGIVMFVFFLAACSSNEDHSNHKNHNAQNLELIDVEVKLTPETLKANEEVKIEAVVTQGKEKVADAKEVKFEIWQSGQEDHEMLKAKNDGKGIYSISKTFTEDGQYFVTAHVTARGLHAMPKKEITVGTPVATNDSHDENHESATHEEEHHHDSELTIDLKNTTEFKANEQAKLNAVVMNADSALSDAKITFEVWEGAEGKPQWIDAKEEGNGLYTAPITFPQAGSYHVQVHVKKDELHDHKVFMFDVK
ncbi:MULTISPECIES: FixH family protein [unclassified Bacillus (in: firmicutes)]|uniref:FixH family protein n=1 Tax=unclassified Bacillus (in: firmicutes) TaxID=185979 RepID=UPI0008F38800|nr:MULTISPECIES: FixH family protein [unclassified Bacillus (in: firmicutes)]SFA80620.1 YtkA-like [Bacillus sp. UNCCL13]SFQ70737.1 YtkA-like [Bacillus sp. cl95]